MNYNDLLRRLRYALRLSDAEALELLALGGRPAAPGTLASWYRKEDEPGYAECDMGSLRALLDGLVAKRRGPRDADGGAPGAAARPELLDNNLVLKKLRVALELREEDLLAIMRAGGVEVSKGELSALFRRKDQKNYKPCLDQFLRRFLAGLAVWRKAIRGQEKLRVVYEDAAGARTERVVWPLALGFMNEARVLAAWCELRQDVRTFRTDRVLKAQPLGETYPGRRAALLKAWRERMAGADQSPDRS